MNFRTRKLIKPEDLNARGTLFGGQVLKWIDEESAIFAVCQLMNKNVVTKAMSEINFVSSLLSKITLPLSSTTVLAFCRCILSTIFLHTLPANSSISISDANIKLMSFSNDCGSYLSL